MNNNDSNYNDLANQPITETTCLLPDLLANSEKLIDEKKRTFFQKPVKEKEDHNDNYDLDDDVNNYVPNNAKQNKTYTDYNEKLDRHSEEPADKNDTRCDYSKDEDMQTKLDLIRNQNNGI